MAAHPHYFALLLPPSPLPFEASTGSPVTNKDFFWGEKGNTVYPF